MIFTKAQVNVIAAIADAVVAPLSPEEQAKLQTVSNTTSNTTQQAAAALSAYISYSGSTDAHAVVELLEQLRPDQRERLQTILNLLDSAAGTFLLTGHFNRFAQLERNERQKAMTSWKTSMLPPLQRLYSTLTGLVVNAIYRNPSCPAYQAIGYQGRDPVRSQKDYQPKHVTERLPMVTLDEVESQFMSKRFDAIIVGSGAGGGVCAAELAAAGQSVLVIEKGTYYHESEFHWDEKTGIKNLIEAQSLLMSENGLAQVFCASAFGGGTTVNWSASLKPQHYVREEWGKKFGLTHFMSPQFVKDLDRVYERIGATASGIKHNKPNQLFIEGCHKLGYPIADVPQNTGGQSHECNWCFYGCTDGIKNGTMNTWLRDAHAKGAQFLDRTKVTRVLSENKKAVGVECVVHNSDTKIKLYADRVIVSAGSMNTPGLLLHSGLTNKHIGRHLRLHPCQFVYGMFDDPVDMHAGSILTTVSNVAENELGGGYGAKIEVPASHMGLFAAILPWRGPVEHKQTMLNYRHFMPLVLISRDKDSVGTVKYNDQGHIAFDYTLSKGDRRSLEAALDRAVMILAAAGARQVHTCQRGVGPFVFAQDEEIRADLPRFQAWRHKVAKYGLPENGVNLYGSAHQMGSCRLGVSPKVSATKPTGETWDVKDLYVADASLFPTASGVNPMVTVEAIALHVAASIIKSTKASAHL
ncbi:hypothetical protein BDB00DRAFT_977784 [Zychaea mexicana]|uniref:uncharacterized protein n=1 Tax=Zychaea mexicana TaxID=64656 RepID=UPI0022FE67B3|nr:uncharacterized protein BDB00DRAFT_977784 [Zychaea mexicana]KAI9491775.1 hypothetical protein BDB00DRAFT_977784 [Zychaea mexicana]